MNICVIIAAAGRSTRFGAGDKLAQDLGGRSVLLRSVEAFAKRDEVRSIIVAGPPGEEFVEFRNKYGPTLGFHGARLVEGGPNHRWETIRNALAAVSDDATHVAVHDAARPAASLDLLARVFHAARELKAVIPVVDVAATVKRVSGEAVAVSEEDDAVADSILGEQGKLNVQARRVEKTIDRAGLVEVQTPQVFEVNLLKRAYAQPNLDGATDDAEIVERLGETVYAVEGDVRNIKITRQADIELIRAILRVPPPAERPVHKRF